MRDIVTNEGLNGMLNEIIDYELNKVIDEMIYTIKEWSNHTDNISCETIIDLLKSNKSIEYKK